MNILISIFSITLTFACLYECVCDWQCMGVCHFVVTVLFITFISYSNKGGNDDDDWLDCVETTLRTAPKETSSASFEFVMCLPGSFFVIRCFFLSILPPSSFNHKPIWINRHKSCLRSIFSSAVEESWRWRRWWWSDRRLQKVREKYGAFSARCFSLPTCNVVVVLLLLLLLLMMKLTSWSHENEQQIQNTWVFY